jgi:hypothetical protein
MQRDVYTDVGGHLWKGEKINDDKYETWFFCLLIRFDARVKRFTFHLYKRATRVFVDKSISVLRSMADEPRLCDCLPCSVTATALSNNKSENDWVQFTRAYALFLFEKEENSTKANGRSTNLSQIIADRQYLPIEKQNTLKHLRYGADVFVSERVNRDREHKAIKAMAPMRCLTEFLDHNDVVKAEIKEFLALLKWQEFHHWFVYDPFVAMAGVDACSVQLDCTRDVSQTRARLVYKSLQQETEESQFSLSSRTHWLPCFFERRN